MVAIAQLAEHRIVVPSVVGSSPTSHPKKTLLGVFFCYYIPFKHLLQRPYLPPIATYLMFGVNSLFNILVNKLLP